MEVLYESILAWAAQILGAPLNPYIAMVVALKLKRTTVVLARL